MWSPPKARILLAGTVSTYFQRLLGHPCRHEVAGGVMGEPVDTSSFSLGVRDHFPQALSVLLQPIVENCDVRAQGEMTHAQV